jgi:hypothetical protein
MLPALGAQIGATPTRRGAYSWWRPRWHVGPGDLAPIHYTHEGRRWLGVGYWGGYTDTLSMQRQDNAKVEHSRMVVVACGVYLRAADGWRYAYRADGSPLLFAALHGHPGTDACGWPTVGVAGILTPSRHLAPLLRLSPILLTRKQADQWLDPATPKPVLEEWLMPGTDGGLTHHRVCDLDLHAPCAELASRPDGPHLIARVEERADVQPL